MHYGLSKTIWRELMKYYSNDTIFTNALNSKNEYIGDIIIPNDNASFLFSGDIKEISWSKMIDQARKQDEGKGRKIRIGTIQTNSYPM